MRQLHLMFLYHVFYGSELKVAGSKVRVRKLRKYMLPAYYLYMLLFFICGIPIALGGSLWVALIWFWEFMAVREFFIYPLKNKYAAKGRYYEIGANSIVVGGERVTDRCWKKVDQ